jgi:hypothetical protein
MAPPATAKTAVYCFKQAKIRGSVPFAEGGNPTPSAVPSYQS